MTWLPLANKIRILKITMLASVVLLTPIMRSGAAHLLSNIGLVKWDKAIAAKAGIQPAWFWVTPPQHVKELFSKALVWDRGDSSAHRALGVAAWVSGQ